MELYKKYGHELTEPEAKKEVVANLFSEMITADEATMNRLCGEKPSLMRQVWTWLKDTIGKLTGVNDPQVDTLKKAARMMEKALGEVSKQEKALEDVDGGKASSYFINTEDDYLLSRDEYARLQSNLNDMRYHGYQFQKRPNGGNLIDMGKLLVYTDKQGKPEQVLEIHTTSDDVFRENDIVQTAMELEQGGMDIESQQGTLESLFGEGSSYFRHSAEVISDEGYRRGNRRPAGGTRQGNRSEISAQKAKNRNSYSLAADGSEGVDDFFTSDEALNASDEHEYSERELNDIMNPNGVSAKRYAGGQMRFEGGRLFAANGDNLTRVELEEGQDAVRQALLDAGFRDVNGVLRKGKRIRQTHCKSKEKAAIIHCFFSYYYLLNQQNRNYFF